MLKTLKYIYQYVELSNSNWNKKEKSKAFPVSQMHTTPETIECYNNIYKMHIWLYMNYEDSTLSTNID